jgi:hypothetical protein
MKLLLSRKKLYDSHAFTLIECLITTFILTALLSFSFFSFSSIKASKASEFGFMQIQEFFKKAEKLTYLCDLDLSFVLQNTEEGLCVISTLERSSKSWTDLSDLGLPRKTVFKEIELIEPRETFSIEFVSKGSINHSKVLVIGDKKNNIRRIEFGGKSVQNVNFPL